MRRLRTSPGLVTAVVGFALLPLVAWGTARRAVTLPEVHSRLELQVEGLDCAFWCPVGVDTALGDLPGVRLEQVDTGAGTVRISFDPEQTAEERIVARIDASWPIRSGVRIDEPEGVRRPVVVDRW